MKPHEQLTDDDGHPLLPTACCRLYRASAHRSWPRGIERLPEPAQQLAAIDARAEEAEMRLLLADAPNVRCEWGRCGS